MWHFVSRAFVLICLCVCVGLVQVASAATGPSLQKKPSNSQSIIEATPWGECRSLTPEKTWATFIQVFKRILSLEDQKMLCHGRAIRNKKTGDSLAAVKIFTGRTTNTPFDLAEVEKQLQSMRRSSAPPVVVEEQLFNLTTADGVRFKFMAYHMGVKRNGFRFVRIPVLQGVEEKWCVVVVVASEVDKHFLEQMFGRVLLEVLGTEGLSVDLTGR